MNKRFTLKFLIATMFISSILTSCITDVDLQNISPVVKLDESLVMPIGETTISIEELMKKLGAESTFGSDGMEVYFHRFDSAEFYFLLKKFAENTRTLDKSYTFLKNEIIYPPNQQIPTVTSNEILNLGLNTDPTRERVDSIQVFSATLSVEVKVDNLNINPSDVKLTLVFPPDKIRKLDGSPSTLLYTPLAFGIPSDVIIPNFILNTSGEATDIPVQIFLDAKTGDLPTVIGPTSTVEVILKLNQINYAVAYGNFPTLGLATDTIQRPIDLFSALPKGNFKFFNPKAILTATSNIGSFLRFKVDYLKAFHKDDSTIPGVYANFGGSQSKTEILDLKPAAPGLWVTKSFAPFDKENGATDLLFDYEKKPNMLEYKFTVQADETLNNGDLTPDFITSDGSIKVKIETQFPFNLKSGSSFELNDTIQNVGTTFRDILENVIVEQATLVLNISNGYPIKAIYNMELKDSMGVTIPSTLKKEYTINAPTVDSNGFVTLDGIKTQAFNIELTPEQIEDLKKTKYIVFKLMIGDENDLNAIHFTTASTFGAKLGVFIKGSTTTSIGSTKN